MVAPKSLQQTGARMKDQLEMACLRGPERAAGRSRSCRQASRHRGRRAPGAFDIVLAGGSTPRGLYERLAAAGAGGPGWHIWFGDERCLGANDPDRNETMARQAWLDQSGIPPSRYTVSRRSAIRRPRRRPIRRCLPVWAISIWCCSVSVRMDTRPACFRAMRPVRPAYPRMPLQSSTRPNRRRSGSVSAPIG